jgi:hypothetical protein
MNSTFEPTTRKTIVSTLGSTPNAEQQEMQRQLKEIFDSDQGSEEKRKMYGAFLAKNPPFLKEMADGKRSIFDESTLEAMCLVEFPDRGPSKSQTEEQYRAMLKKNREEWKRQQLAFDRPDSLNYSWRGAQVDWLRNISLHTLDELPMLTNAIHVIYGVGGWHRYMVTIDGCVHFSWHHCPDAATRTRAQELGFSKW